MSRGTLYSCALKSCGGKNKLEILELGVLKACSVVGHVVSLHLMIISDRKDGTVHLSEKFWMDNCHQLCHEELERSHRQLLREHLQLERSHALLQAHAQSAQDPQRELQVCRFHFSSLKELKQVTGKFLYLDFFFISFKNRMYMDMVFQGVSVISGRHIKREVTPLHLDALMLTDEYLFLCFQHSMNRRAFRCRQEASCRLTCSQHNVEWNF